MGCGWRTDAGKPPLKNPKTKKACIDSWAGEGAVEQALNGVPQKAQTDQSTRRSTVSRAVVRNAQSHDTMA